MSKKWGGGSTNAVGNTVPLVGIGLSDLTKIGGASSTPGTPGSAIPE